jgi:hypothetical protein
MGTRPPMTPGQPTATIRPPESDNRGLRAHLCRLVLILFVVAAAWALAVLLTGGFALNLGLVRIRSRSPWNAVFIAMAIGVLTGALAKPGHRRQAVAAELDLLLRGRPHSSYRAPATRARCRSRPSQWSPSESRRRRSWRAAVHALPGGASLRAVHARQATVMTAPQPPGYVLSLPWAVVRSRTGHQVYGLSEWWRSKATARSGPFSASCPCWAGAIMSHLLMGARSPDGGRRRRSHVGDESTCIN